MSAKVPLPEVNATWPPVVSTFPVRKCTSSLGKCTRSSPADTWNTAWSKVWSPAEPRSRRAVATATVLGGFHVHPLGVVVARSASSQQTASDASWLAETSPSVT